MRKLRIIPWLLGIGVIVTSLAGANHFFNQPQSQGGGGPAPAPAPVVPDSNEGLVAKGTVESDPPVVAYSLPAHLPAGTIVEVAVTSGQTVKVGDPLLRYDDTLLQKDKIDAELGYNLAVQDYNKAAAELKVHGTKIELAKLGVKAAEQRQTEAKEGLDLARKAFNTDFDIRLKNGNVKEEDRARHESEFAPIVLARHSVSAAENAVTKAKLELQLTVESVDGLNEIVKQAQFKAALVKNTVEKATQAIQDCTLKAKAAGTIERMTAAVGQTVYPQSKPLLYLVPSGKRIVVAEIVPDFAYKIKGREGQTVEISDDSHTALKYVGRVKRISDAFLPKASGTVDLTGKPNAVLNVEIEVTDATPAGKPPLRVGQPVRVSFP